jgi:hypothetical protein
MGVMALSFSEERSQFLYKPIANGRSHSKPRDLSMKAISSEVQPAITASQAVPVVIITIL